MLNVRKRGSLSGHAQPVYVLAQAHLSHHIISAGGDRWIALWNLQSMQSEKAIAQATSTVYALCFIPGFNYLVIGEASGSIHFIDLEKYQSVRNIQYHQHPVFHLKYHASSERLFASTADGCISAWNVNDGKLIHEMKITNDKIRSMDFHESQNLFVAGASDTKVYLFELDTLQPVHSFEAHLLSLIHI